MQLNLKERRFVISVTNANFSKVSFSVITCFLELDMFEFTVA